MSTLIAPRCLRACRQLKAPQVITVLHISLRAHSTENDKPTPPSAASSKEKASSDPRLKPQKNTQDRVIIDDYANLRENYDVPKNPIILAHGLFGFDELHIAGARLPGIHYWRGITEALTAKGVEVITASVPASGSIEERAQALADTIDRKARGKSVNIMAGLDSRYMISRLKPPGVKVLSLTTIATPHRGSTFADFIFKTIPPLHIPRVYRALHALGLATDAFSQLTRTHMHDSFNPSTPDLPSVRYYSYGAALTPSLFSVFRHSERVVRATEGANDGLVSVRSSRWGEYKGTLQEVSHLDLINWSNRVKWWIWGLWGGKRQFNAIAFYLSIADMLAKEGL